VTATSASRESADEQKLKQAARAQQKALLFIFIPDTMHKGRSTILSEASVL